MCRYKTAKGVGTVVLPDGSSSSQEAMKQELTRTVIEFLDDHGRARRKYPYHRYALERTRQSNQEFERNCRPGTLKVDVDHIENYTVEDARSIQSEYWLQIQVSLFMNVSRLLLTSAYNVTNGKLEAGNEVTVQLTTAGGYDHYGFWAQVTTEYGGSSPTSFYMVQDKSGVQHKVQRRYLRHRKWHTVALVGVTGDLKYDSYASRYWIKEQLQWWEDDYSKAGKEPITHVALHSDNATHFKSSKTLSSFSHYLESFLWILALTWDYGCPGHGKGVWDGLGGLMKRNLRHCTVQKRVLSDFGLIKNWLDVRQHLQRTFETPEWKQAHQCSTVNEFVVQGVAEFQRPSVDYEFEFVFGIRKNFSYCALRKYVVLQREWGCWCPACMHALSKPGRSLHLY